MEMSKCRDSSGLCKGNQSHTVVGGLLASARKEGISGHHSLVSLVEKSSGSARLHARSVGHKHHEKDEATCVHGPIFPLLQASIYSNFVDVVENRVTTI